MSEDEVTAVGNVFVEATRTMGLDGAKVFEGLRQGKTMGEALGMPSGVRDLLYSRAHRWFSIGRIDRAEPLFRALCVLDQDTGDHWVGYGVCLRLREDLPNAGQAFRAASIIRGDWAVPHFHLMELAVHQQDWPAASEHLANYQQRVRPDIAPAIKAEADRLKAAIVLKRSGSKPD